MTNTTPGTYEKGKRYDLDITNVQPDPEQPRKYFDEQARSELSASITSRGVLQPILVRESADGVFIIVSGERRYQATQKSRAGDNSGYHHQRRTSRNLIIENLLRENLTAIEEAEAIERLRGVHSKYPATLPGPYDCWPLEGA